MPRRRSVPVSALAAALTFGGMLLASPARADEPGPATTLPVTTIVGRANRPNVTIVLARPTAAREAGAAHDAMRTAWLARTEPVPSTAR